ncbi:MAG TPA: diguanylate cyclase [Burkholderiales bacterium]|nr:diguanylate cyclase [Burkholderiales bacterium]
MSTNPSSRLPGKAEVPAKDAPKDHSDLSPELIEIVRALQASLAEKRVRQQLQSVDSNQPSKLESAFSAQQAKHRAGRSDLAGHPQLIAAVVESADAGIISETWNGVLLTWNKGAERIFGYTAEEMIGSSRACLIPEFLKGEDAKVMRHVIEGKSTLNRETVWQHKDGKFIDVAVSFSPVVEDDKVVRLSVVVNDVTERKRMERALMESERKQRQRAAELRIVLDAVPAAVCIAHDPECKSVTGNRMAYDMLRLPQGSNLAAAPDDGGTAASFRMFRNGRALEVHELPVQMAAFRGIEVRDFEQDIVFDDGSIRHLIGNAAPLRDAAGKVYGAVGAFIDITARRNMEEQIRRMAHFDPLTNLPNRILLMDRLEQALAISQRNHSKTSVIFMDLDHFKEINDSLGHHVGDMLLQHVAERIRGALREVDTVSRLGGDEFVMVLPELRHTEDARTIADKLLRAIEEDFFVSGDRLRISPSLGISIFPDHATDASTLIRIADKAMYHAKQSGRNTYRFYDDTMKS